MRTPSNQKHGNVLENKVSSKRPEELSRILENLLESCILNVFDQQSAAFRKTAQHYLNSLEQTFLGALTHTRTDLELLKLIKDFARSRWNSHEPDLPKRVCMTLFYASIAAAYCFHGILITRQHSTVISSELSWLNKQPWMNSELKKLFSKGIENLASR